MHSAEDENENNASIVIAEGCMVEVERRCWPGMNKPGGFAMVKRLLRLDNSSEGENQVTHVDVWYPVEGKKESRVPIKYIKIASDLMPIPTNSMTGKDDNPTEFTGRRKRNTLGRCTRCHSLRQDCGSCDWKEEQRLRDLSILGVAPQQASCGTKMKRKKAGSRPSHQHDVDQIMGMPTLYTYHSDGFSSDDDDSFSSSMMVSQKATLDNNLSDDEDDLLGFVPFRCATTKGSNKRTQKSRHSTSILENLMMDRDKTQGRIRDHEKFRNVGAITNHSSGQRLERNNVCDVLDVLKISNHSPTYSPRAFSSKLQQFSCGVSIQQLEENDSQGMRDMSLPLPLQGYFNHSPEKDPNSQENFEFIQPEGSPSDLPVDIVNRSHNVDYINLIDLFQEIASMLEIEKIPDFEIRLARIKARVRRRPLLTKQLDTITFYKQW